ncbi:leptin [Tachyglossus aculeatus]|uniref:leptin n=1 Tax=Tachyglossus aculeatus TaxID=9261 RepID=UPI0018F47BC7|nr:leptin [Tachyglossus aculeatus]
MRCILLYGFLCAWQHLYYSHPISIEKIQADTKTLTKTIITRIIQLSNRNGVSTDQRVSGLDFIPGNQQFQNLADMDQTLAVYQQILSSLPMPDRTQISNDLENLRSLFALLATLKSCPFTRSDGLDTMEIWGGIVEESLYSTEVVTLDRLRKSLKNIEKQLDHIQGC